MPMSEIEEHLACNEKYIEMKNKVMEEEKEKQLKNQQKQRTQGKYKRR